MNKGLLNFLFGRKFYVFDSLEAAKQAVPEGKAIRVNVENRELCLTRKGDSFFAFDNQCPHKGLPLHQGIMENDGWVCPFHRYCFSLKSGKNLTVDHVETLRLLAVSFDTRGLFIRI